MSGPPPAPALFRAGDRVRAKNMHPTTHTRLPRYVRGRRAWSSGARLPVFPDSSALGAGDDPQWLYTVVFDGSELWGADADPTLKVSVDAFEPYLEPGMTAIDPAAAHGVRKRCRAFRATRGPGFPRALGGAGLRDGGRAATSAACSPGRSGRQRSPRRSARAGRRRSRYRRDLLPALARRARADGRRRRASPRRRRSSATAMPGTAPPTARRTASRSS